MNVSFFSPLSGRTKMKGCHGEAWSCRGRKKGKKKKCRALRRSRRARNWECKLHENRRGAQVCEGD